MTAASSAGSLPPQHGTPVDTGAEVGGVEEESPAGDQSSSPNSIYGANVEERGESATGNTTVRQGHRVVEAQVRVHLQDHAWRRRHRQPQHRRGTAGVQDLSPAPVLRETVKCGVRLSMCLRLPQYTCSPAVFQRCSHRYVLLRLAMELGPRFSVG